MGVGLKLLYQKDCEMAETEALSNWAAPGNARAAIPRYARAEPLSLKDHPHFTERWLQELIAADPTIVGLGTVDVIQRERSQHKAGRLDLLLYDRAEDIRYEVELMLGSADESHIVRCIEYWDIERRRYPAYDHCAVLVAENVTSRYLNVLSLIAGSIPLIVIQLSALQLGDQVTLNFVRVLDRLPLRRDDEAEVVTTAADREFWVKRAAAETVSMADEVVRIINEKTPAPLQLRFNRSYIGLHDGGRARNIVWMEPTTRFTYLMTNSLAQPEPWRQKLENAGLNVGVQKASGNLRISLKPADLHNQREVIRELLHAIVAESQST
jgi:hypothetical protein